jgi:hypothetical protein
MPRGGARVGAGRKRDPESANAKRIAARAARDLAKQMTSDGVKKPDAPATWPFGTKPPGEPEVPPPETAAAPEAAPEIPAGPADELPVAAMLRVMRETTDPRLILMAATAAAPYLHPKKAPISAKAEGGAEKKTSRFAPPAPPRLVSSR